MVKDWDADVARTVNAGDHYGALRAIAVILACRLERASPRDTTPLAGRLQKVLAEIRAEKPPTASALDEITRRRADRLRAASEADSPVG